MDWTTLQHTLIALACTSIGWLFGNTLAGATFGVALLIGREHAQAEYRWISKHGGLRASMPWWGGFDVKIWDLGSLTDWLVPLVVTCCVLFCLQRFGVLHS